MDAARHRSADQRTHVFRGHRTLILMHARRAATIGNGLILQIALAALIANRAIERVVDEQKFHHAFAGLFDHGRVGADFLPLACWQSAGCLRLGRARRNLDQTHAAIARNAEALVIAETRDFLARKLARLQHSRARWDFDLFAVYFELRHL